MKGSPMHRENPGRRQKPQLFNAPKVRYSREAIAAYTEPKSTVVAASLAALSHANQGILNGPVPMNGAVSIAP